MRIIIVASSPYKSFLNYEYQQGDIFIGIENGCHEILKRGFNLDIAIGDFDTTSYLDEIKEKAIKFIPHSPVKDEIDLELALKYIIDHNLKSNILIYDALMGRLDHELITIKLLVKYQFLDITLVSLTEEIKYLTKDYELTSFNKRFSLIPLGSVTIEVKDALYNLDKTNLDLTSCFTSSNKTLDNLTTKIKVYSGGIILVKES